MTTPLSTLWLSCHVHYACRHAGACCRSGWPLPVESQVVPAIDAAVAAGRLRTVDGSPVWLLASAEAPTGVAGTFRLAEDACVFHAAPRRGDAAHGSAARHCAVHAVEGHEALPASCQHFPRVCLVDGRGVRVSLSHYCPTAASLLFEHEGPVEIVPGPPAVPGLAVPEGLDVRDELPPRLTPGVLMDLEALTAWEQLVVQTLAGSDAPAGTPAEALALLRAYAERLVMWTPGDAPLLHGDCRAARRQRHGGRRRPFTSAERGSDGGPYRLERQRRAMRVVAQTCRAPWTWPATPANVDALDRAFVAPEWPAAGAARAPLPGGQGVRRLGDVSGRCGARAGALAAARARRAARRSGAGLRRRRTGRSMATCSSRPCARPTCCSRTTPTGWPWRVRSSAPTLDRPSRLAQHAPAHGGADMRTRLLILFGAVAVATIASACAPNGNVDAQAPAAAPAAAPNPLPGVTKSLDVLKAEMFHVGAGRRLKPAAWPGGNRVAVALSFDVDNATMALSQGNLDYEVLSRGEYGAVDGLPRILRLLDTHQMPASFFIPAVSALLHPQMVPDIQAKGHARDRHPRLDPRAAADAERREGRAAAARPVARDADQADGQAAGRLPRAVVEVQQVHAGADRRRPASSTTAA